jgi:NADPH-dependent F420 reductase
MSTSQPVIAVLGGTGDLGGGLVYRWAKAGFDVIIGSRKQEAALEAVTKLKARVPSARVRGMENQAAAQAARIVVMTVPFAHQQATLASVKEAVQGKIFIDVTVALNPPKVGTVQLPKEGSAGVICQQTLGDAVKVVSAFQNIAAAHLDSDHDVHCDVLVTGNDKEARQTVIDLANAIGLKAWHAGPIANSAATEALTSVLITLNKQYKIPGAGIVITGEPGV